MRLSESGHDPKPVLGGLTVYGKSQVQDGDSSESLWAPVGTLLQNSREQEDGVPAEP